MKKNLITTVSFVTLLSSFYMVLTEETFAEDIIYYGTQEDFDTKLQNIPSGSGNNILTAVDYNNNTNGNTITVANPNNISLSEYKVPSYVYGGYSDQEGKTISDNTVIIQDIDNI